MRNDLGVLRPNELAKSFTISLLTIEVWNEPMDFLLSNEKYK